ncbi:MAG TPA: HlyD family efflux transporter periplasmic adaptor subunit [Syntrophothermus lipocalidus]|nr:HlyD family efflux transporter periplasmic adaptor subunit [Syntrophothermus lipocalidus]
MDQRPVNRGTYNPYRVIALVAVGLLALSLTTFGWLNYREQKLLASRGAELEVTGNIEADEVMVAFKVPGKIACFAVDEGDEVKPGQVLATLETDELKTQVAQAKAALEAAKVELIKAQNAVGLQSGVSLSQVQEAEAAVRQAQANLDICETTWKRIQDLYASGAVSAQDKDKAEAEYKAALARLAQAQAALEKAKSGELQVTLSENDVAAAQAQVALAQAKYDEAVVYLNNATLKSPLAGIVTLRLMEPGETVGAGTPVLRITDLKNTWVKVFVGENRIGRVKPGTKAKVKVAAFDNREFDGVVKWVNPAGDFATQKAVNDQYDRDIRSFEVKVSIPNPDLELKTGMTATVRFSADE